MSLNEDPRTERTQGLKAQVGQQDKQALYSLVNSASWPVLLDVIERCCIEQETKLINCDVADEKAILAEHRMSKAYWQIFVGMQKTVLMQAREFAGVMEEKDPDEIAQILSIEGMQFHADSVGK